MNRPLEWVSPPARWGGLERLQQRADVHAQRAAPAPDSGAQRETPARGAVNPAPLPEDESDVRRAVDE